MIHLFMLFFQFITHIISFENHRAYYVLDINNNIFIIPASLKLGIVINNPIAQQCI